MKKPFLIVISLSLFVTSYSQTYQKNFVRKQFPKSAIESVIGVQEAQVIEGDKVDVTTYYDGVNRPIRTVNKEASRHSRDFVSVAEYDEFSRQAKEYLPFSTNENNGNYKNNALIKQADFYETAQKVAHSSYPYANTEYESSPLQRILKQGFAGYDWQTSSNGHPLSFSYRFNYANEVRKWDENQGDFSSNSFYPANSLSVTIQNDENRAENGDGLQTIVFTDTRGRKIMKLVKRYYEQSKRIICYLLLL
ncbi:MAG: DUF6443 domain-containing protein [Bacteroidota bacterium]|nr:DUF6443 domain-containing protein [Bacteroidota bacterium]